MSDLRRPDEPGHHQDGALVTVVIPTFNERDNIGPLLDRLSPVLHGLPVEVLFVDDSQDDTPQRVTELAPQSRLDVRLIHRVEGARTGGLGGAVLTGLRATSAEWVIVMDGDLQHPPELLRPMLAAAVSNDADVVVASRYLDGGSADGLANSWRRRASRAAAALARLLFPRRLDACSDPMSGFFLIRRRAIALDALRPDGFKILLEILARSSGVRISEVPFRFASRATGESKADLRQGLVYVRHLLRLRTGGVSSRLLGFLAIGATGTVPNLLTMALLGWLGMHYLMATAVATVVAATSNFLLTDALLFRGRAGRRMRERWAAYLGLSVVDIMLRIPLMALLVERLAIGVLPSTAISIVGAGVLRFVVVDRWLYRADVALTVTGEPPAGSSTPRPAEALGQGHRLLEAAMLRAA